MAELSYDRLMERLRILHAEKGREIRDNVHCDSLLLFTARVNLTKQSRFASLDKRASPHLDP